MSKENFIKHFQCFTNRKIARMKNLEEHTVSIYIKNYKTKEIYTLAMKRTPGAKRNLNPKPKNAFEE